MKGGYGVADKIIKLRNQLLSRVDSTDLVQLEKVERYIKLVKLDKKLDETIEKEGASVTTENGQQRFIKSHPAIADKIKISGMLLSIEKSFAFDHNLNNKRKTHELI